MTELRKLAEAARDADPGGVEWTPADGPGFDDIDRYCAAANPATILLLLDVVDAARAARDHSDRTGRWTGEDWVRLNDALARLAATEGSDKQ